MTTYRDPLTGNIQAAADLPLVDIAAEHQFYRALADEWNARAYQAARALHDIAQLIENADDDDKDMRYSYLQDAAQLVERVQRLINPTNCENAGRNER